MGKVGFKIAIVEFRGKVYSGYPYEDNPNVWHFKEINGLGHFRATKDKGFWDNYEYDHEAVFGIEIEDKNRELYKMLTSLHYFKCYTDTNTTKEPKARTRCKGCGTLYTEKELEILKGKCDRCGMEIPLKPE